MDYSKASAIKIIRIMDAENDPDRIIIDHMVYE